MKKKKQKKKQKTKNKQQPENLKEVKLRSPQKSEMEGHTI
jgi:hypothetical protein